MVDKVVPEQIVLGSIRKLTDQTSGTSVSSTPVWPLLQVLPPGSQCSVAFSSVPAPRFLILCYRRSSSRLQVPALLASMQVGIIRWKNLSLPSWFWSWCFNLGNRQSVNRCSHGLLSLNETHPHREVNNSISPQSMQYTWVLWTPEHIKVIWGSFKNYNTSNHPLETQRSLGTVSANAFAYILFR